MPRKRPVLRAVCLPRTSWTSEASDLISTNEDQAKCSVVFTKRWLEHVLHLYLLVTTMSHSRAEVPGICTSVLSFIGRDVHAPKALTDCVPYTCREDQVACSLLATRA